MKPCIFPVGFRPKGKSFIPIRLEDLVPRAVEMGFEGMELLSDHLDDYLEREGNDLPSLKTLCEHHGLEIPTVSTYLIKSFDGPEAKEAVARNFQRCLECAVQLGSQAVAAFVALPQAVPDSAHLSPQDWETCIDFLTPLVKDCGENGIAFALGSHGGTLTDTIAATSKATDDLGEEHIKLFLDYGNLHLVGEDPLRAVDLFYDQTILVRAQAYLAREKKQVPLGEGDVDDRQVLTRLKEKGYQGFVSLKYHAADDVWDKLAQGIKFVRSI